MPKNLNGFPMPTAKKQFQIFNLHPNFPKNIFKKNMVLKLKNYPLLFVDSTWFSTET